MTPHQHTYLNAMGIELWQRKTLITDQSSKVSDDNKKAVAQVSVSEKIDLSSLHNSTLFADILLSMGLSLGDVSLQENTLNIGWLNWRFVEEKNISLTTNTLYTPSLEKIATSSELKTQLWQIIFNQS